MKKIAIIGSESFLARNLLFYIHKNFGPEQYEIKLYDFKEKSQNLNEQYLRIDFSDIGMIRQIDFNVDYIFVFTGKTGTVTGFYEFEQFIRINEVYLLNFLKTYVESNSKARIIYPSTRLIFRECADALISEDDRIELKSVYAVTKYASEQYLKIYKNVYNINYVILRICTPIGTLLPDYGNYGTFEIFKKQAIQQGKIIVYGDGLQRKTFTKMEDICKAFLLLTKDRLQRNDYNLGGQALTLLDIASAIAKEYDVPIIHMAWPDMDAKVDGGSVVFDSKRFDREFAMEYSEII